MCSMQVPEREAVGQGPEGGPALPEAQVELPAPPKSPAFDLFNLVVSSKRLEIYLEPLQDAWEGICFLLRWQMPLCSLLTCLALNFLLLTLTEAAWFVLGALLVLLPALVGYLGEACRACPPAPELLRRSYHSVRREDLRQVRLARYEALAEVKRFLMQLEGMLGRACSACEGVYRVLHWENPALSSQFYGALLGSLCVLYLLPLCWVLALLNSAVFLGNTHFCRVLLEIQAAVQQHLGTQPLANTPEPTEPEAGAEAGGTLADWTPTPTSTEDLTPGSVEEAEEAEPDEEFKDAIEETQLSMEDDEVSQCSADSDLPEGGTMSKNEVIRSKVSRLTERLRKRYPSNNFGSCTGCAATFSVLKKRRSCSNCGNSFCSRCCSYKVPKSSMGATAPDAQREMVFVCALCNQALVK